MRYFITAQNSKVIGFGNEVFYKTHNSKVIVFGIELFYKSIEFKGYSL